MNAFRRSGTGLGAVALGVALSLAGCARGPARVVSPEPPPVPGIPEVETGIASFYASRFDGRRTASGERHDADALTAAHPRLAFGTRVRVTNLENRRSVVVRINDRGPFARGRIIDLSQRAARTLGFLRAGLAQVAVEVIDRPPRDTAARRDPE
jgi:rare lipoprotein A